MRMLHKSIPLSQAQVKSTNDGDVMQFEGYASVFDGVDSYGDTIQKGAYAETLDSGQKVAMLFGHRSDKPIGKWLDMKEDEVGLKVTGELTPGLQLAQDTHALLKHGAVDGLSIGYWVKCSEDLEGGGRLLTKILLDEISVVTLPADGAARIATVKQKGTKEFLNEIESLSNLRDCEQFLRDSGAFSRAAVTKMVAQIKRLTSQSESDDALTQAIDALHKRARA